MNFAGAGSGCVEIGSGSDQGGSGFADSSYRFLEVGYGFSPAMTCFCTGSSLCDEEDGTQLTEDPDNQLSGPTGPLHWLIHSHFETQAALTESDVPILTLLNLM